MKSLGIIDLLGLSGFDSTDPTKLVRHQDKRWDVHELLRSGWLDLYQGYQSRPVFRGCRRIISFVGTEGTKARLVGLYRVLGVEAGAKGPWPPGCPHTEWRNNPYYYDLQREAGYEHLENRVVIEWGKGTLAWHQRVSNKEVVEVLPKGHLLQPFRDYLEFTLTHSELRQLYANAEANREWRARLAAVAGVYLILATTSGSQYVGSAHGVDGIWGRWSRYARDGHGGNGLLKKLVEADPAYPAQFVYSVLQILPRTLAREEVIGWEGRYKRKLGTRAIELSGLNVN